jgi:hypothetical protein
VNSAPSLATGSPFDLAIKTSVVKGALSILNITPGFKRAVKSRRRRLGDGRTYPDPPGHRPESPANTQYRMIYPLDRSHPMYEATERAFAEAQTSTIAGGGRSARPRPRTDSPLVRDPLPQAPKQPVSQVARPSRKQQVVAPVQRHSRAFPTVRPATVPPPPVTKEMALPAFQYFADIPGEVIDPREEKARLHLLRTQWATSQLIGLLPKVAKLATGATDTRARQISVVPAFKTPTARVQIAHSYQLLF